MDVLVLRVGVVPHLTAAVRTAENIAEDTLRSVSLFRCALMRAFQPLLHLFIGVSLDDRLVSFFMPRNTRISRLSETALCISRPVVPICAVLEVFSKAFYAPGYHL